MLRFLRPFFHRHRLDRDMSEEMRAHLDAQTQRNLAAGMAPDDARAAAHRQFGGVAQIQERARDARGVRWFDDFTRDVSLAWRVLRKRRAHTLLSVATLALGIGLVATQFAFVNGVQLKGLPFEDADDILHLYRVHQHGGETYAQPRDFLEWRAQQKHFASLGAFSQRILTLSGAGMEPQRYFGAAMSAEVLPILLVAPVLGRTFRADENEPGSPVVALLGHDVWRTEFGADPGVIGRSIRVEGEPATIVGVMPRGFRFPKVANVWVNLRPEATRTENLNVIGRLRPDATVSTARHEMDAIAAQLERRDPLASAGYNRTSIVPYNDTLTEPGAVAILWTMLAMVGGVLLIACTNVANLLLTGAVRRGRELATRVALGAGRARLITQLLTESILLTGLGAIGGLFLTWWLTLLLDRRLRATDAPFWMDVSIDARVLAVVTGVSVLAGLATGIVPALQTSRADPNAALNDGSHSNSGVRIGRFNRGLIRLQIAISCALLIVTGLLTKRVVQAQTSELPYSPAGLLTGRLDLVPADFPEAADRRRFFAGLQARLTERTEVVAVGLTSRHPVEPGRFARTEIRGHVYSHQDTMPQAYLETVTAGFFAMLRVPLIEGREFLVTDTAGSEPVAIVNQSFAETYWPGESPVGKYLRRSGEENRWARVVGVVPDLQMQGLLGRNAPRGCYLSQEQEPANRMIVLVRTAGDPLAMAAPLRGIVRELGPNQPVAMLETLAAGIDDQLSVPALIRSLFGLFSSAALLLAAVGIYGVLSFSATQRTREFAIRLALGAPVSAILRGEMTRGLRSLLLSLAAGAVVGWALSRPLTVVLGDLPGIDLLIYGPAVGVVALVTLSATWLPARRATKVDPMVALRAE